ncbi:MAG: IS4 family transposase [Gammaproteobacteria bacterium]|nr:IS4 family transposase [Gammaproteobacteria bacterium]
MKIGLREFDSQSIEWFKGAASSGDYTRSGLARELCERSGWHSHRGVACEAQARKMLPRLASALSVELPEPGGVFAERKELKFPGPAPELRMELQELGELSVVAVRPRESGAWRAMMHAHHPHGDPRVPGKCLKYWLMSGRHGALGGLSFHAASWHERERDRWIGWSQRARAAHLDEVLNNTRFLIMPGVRVYGLASAALRLASDRLCADWLERYGRRPMLAYTHVDGSHQGGSYRAAGWERIGATSGRRCAEGLPKQVFVRVLQPDWERQLCAEPSVRFRPVLDVAMDDGVHWTDLEYGRSTHPDGRMAKRILLMGRAWDESRADEIPRMFKTSPERRAAYRLLSSGNVSMNDILESHRQSTVSRSAQHEVVLSVQDSTGLNFDTLKKSTGGLTSIGGTARGICAHANLAFSDTGKVLGVLDIDGSFRARCAAGGKDLKESVRWSEGLETACELSDAVGERTRVVSVSDREGDVWELFDRQSQLSSRVGLLVRSNGSRRRKAVIEGEGTRDLRSHVEAGPVAAERLIEIDEQGGRRARAARTAKVSLRISKVRIKAPGKGQDSLPLIAVSAREDHPPAGVKKPLNWLLLCSEGEADAGNALRICQWYEARWGIEEYFRILKSGTKISKRQCDDAVDLVKCLAFDAITAWRVFELQRLARSEPDELASRVVDREEIEICQILLSGLYRTRPAPAPPGLTVREHAVQVGRLAGFLPTRRQPLPGTKLLWLGMVEVLGGMRSIRAYKRLEATLDDGSG